jgi:hypothetical protein
MAQYFQFWINSFLDAFNFSKGRLEFYVFISQMFIGFGGWQIAKRRWPNAVEQISKIRYLDNELSRNGAIFLLLFAVQFLAFGPYSLYQQKTSQYTWATNELASARDELTAIKTHQQLLDKPTFKTELDRSEQKRNRLLVDVLTAPQPQLNALISIAQTPPVYQTLSNGETVDLDRAVAAAEARQAQRIAQEKLRVVGEAGLRATIISNSIVPLGYFLSKLSIALNGYAQDFGDTISTAGFTNGTWLVSENTQAEIKLTKNPAWNFQIVVGELDGGAKERISWSVRCRSSALVLSVTYRWGNGFEYSLSRGESPILNPNESIETPEGCKPHMDKLLELFIGNQQQAFALTNSSVAWKSKH